MTTAFAIAGLLLISALMLAVFFPVRRGRDVIAPKPVKFAPLGDDE